MPLICLRPPAFVEAVSLGARGFSIDEVAIRSLDNVRVLRLKDDVPYARELREAAAVYAGSRLLSEYWTTGALLSVDPEATLPQRSRYFCSHLVAQAYYDAGLRSGKDPSKTLPNDFLAWPVIDVTKDILRQERSTPGIRRTFYDAPKVESAHDPLVKVSQAVCRRVRETFLAHGLGEPGNFQETLAALLVIKDSSTAAAIDCAFLSALNKTGFKEYFHKAIVNEYQSFFYDMDWVAKLVKLLTVRRSKLAARLCEKFVANRLNALKRHYAAYSSDSKLCETAVSDLASSIYSLSSEIPWKTFSGAFLEAHERTGLEAYRVIALMLQDLDEGREFGRQGLGHLINLLEASVVSQ